MAIRLWCRRTARSNVLPVWTCMIKEQSQCGRWSYRQNKHRCPTITYHRVKQIEIGFKCIHVVIARHILSWNIERHGVVQRHKFWCSACEVPRCCTLTHSLKVWLLTSYMGTMLIWVGICERTVTTMEVTWDAGIINRYIMFCYGSNIRFDGIQKNM